MKELRELVIEDKELLERLKAVFSEIFPDAAEVLRRGRGPGYREAACLWHGFKVGYVLAKKEGTLGGGM